MTAVIEVLSIHAVVFYRVPAGGLHRADVPPLLRGHELRPHAGAGDAAAAQSVQGAVGLKGHVGDLLRSEVGLVAVYRHVGRPAVGREIVQGHRRLSRREGASRCQDQQERQGQNTRKDPCFHRVYTSIVIFSWDFPGKSRLSALCHGPSAKSRSKYRSPG